MSKGTVLGIGVAVSKDGEVIPYASEPAFSENHKFILLSDSALAPSPRFPAIPNNMQWITMMRSPTALDMGSLSTLCSQSRKKATCGYRSD